MKCDFCVTITEYNDSNKMTRGFIRRVFLYGNACSPGMKFKKKRVRYMKKERECTTFIVEIKDTQAQSWQGRVRWVEKGECCSFRSALELIKLMDSAVSSESVTMQTE